MISLRYRLVLFTEDVTTFEDATERFVITGAELDSGWPEFRPMPRLGKAELEHINARGLNVVAVGPIERPVK